VSAANLKSVGYCLGSVLLCALTIHPFELWPLVPFCWVPLVIALHGMTPAAAWRIGLLHGTLLNLVAFYWLVPALVTVANLPFIPSAGLLLLLAAVQGGRTSLVAILFSIAVGRGASVPMSLTLSMVSCELIYPYVFPWQTGLFARPILPWIQLAEFGGMLAISCWIAAANGLLALAWLRYERGWQASAKWTGASALVVLLVTMAGRSRIQSLQPAIAAAPTARIGVIQGFWGSPELPWDAVRHYREASLSLLQKEPALDFIVWPETAVRAPTEEASLSRTLRTHVHRDATEGPESPAITVPLLTGMVIQKDAGIAESPANDGRSGGLWNSAVMSTAYGAILGRYDKQVLVPLGERRVSSEWLPMLGAALPVVNEFLPGEPRPPLQIPQGRIAVSICYEDILRATFRETVGRSQPELLVNLTSDRWFANSPGPGLHLALASFRAVEHRRFLLRATSTGITALVGPSGAVEWQLPPDRAASGVARVSWLRTDTVYGQIGDWPWIGLAVLGGIWLTGGGVRAAYRSRAG
jgi:apolipoprotein N-acyltransferase